MKSVLGILEVQKTAILTHLEALNFETAQKMAVFALLNSSKMISRKISSDRKISTNSTSQDFLTL